MSARSETDVIEHEIRVAARPEIVFSYFTDPRRMVRWMGADATLDPRPGGVCRIAFRAPQGVVELMIATYAGERSVPPVNDGVNAMLGQFVEVEPYRRIVFTWGYENELFEMPPQTSAVEVTLAPDGDHTLLRLVHRRLPAVAAPFHRAGWEHYLPRLAMAVTGGDPGPDLWQAEA